MYICAPEGLGPKSGTWQSVEVREVVVTGGVGAEGLRSSSVQHIVGER